MPKYSGVLKKMLTENDVPIRYFLNFEDDFLSMNQLIGKELHLEHTSYQCMGCGKNKPIFRMGFCKNCFFTLPQANASIIRPELSTAHLGKEQRDLEWEKKFELQPHIVYLAVSGGLKVGVTRAGQVPTRWIDQGASQAIQFAQTENRYQAGKIEVALKAHLADKTHWQKMLKGQNPEVDLVEEKQKLFPFLDKDSQGFFSSNNQVWNLTFPLETPPEKVKSLKLNLDGFSGTLSGIKGQYLIFDDGRVFNVRNHEGYQVNLEL